MKVNIDKLCVRDIVKYVEWKDVKRAIKYYYPTDKNNYEQLFYDIGKMRKVKVKPTERLIITGGINKDWDWSSKFMQDYFERLADPDGCEEQYYSVDLLDLKTKQLWAVDFIKWSKMVSLPIEEGTLKYFTFVDIIAHFIWEITFYGTEEDSQKQAKMLRSRVKEIEDGTAKTAPLEDLIKDLKKK